MIFYGKNILLSLVSLFIMIFCSNTRFFIKITRDFFKNIFLFFSNTRFLLKSHIIFFLKDYVHVKKFHNNVFS